MTGAPDIFSVAPETSDDNQICLNQTGSVLSSYYHVVGPLLLSDDSTASVTSRVLQAVAFLFLAVLGSGANSLVIMVFYRRPTLRSPSNRFVLSLVLANLVASLVVVPVLLIQLLHRDPWWLRPVASGLTTLAVTASIFSILAIAVDRYNAVLSPLHYAMTITRQRSRGMIAGAWGLAGILAAPPMMGAVVRPPAAPPHDLQTCTTDAGSELFRLTYTLLLVTLGFTVPLFALCWIYAKMYKAAHRNSERTRRHSISTNPGEQIMSRPESRGGSLDFPLPPGNNGTPDNFRRVGKNSHLSNMSIPKRRCSNASFSTLLFREEGRAVKTAAMVIASYLFCWTMYFATILGDTWGVVGNNSTARPVPDQCRFLALLFALSSGSITPFIYVFRNEAARTEAIRLILWWRYGTNATRCGRDFEAYNNGKPSVAGNASANAGFGHTVQDNFSLRRQSLSFCDSISVQSFQIPTATVECRHCNDPAPGLPTADFVATYEVIECPNDGEENKPSLEQSHSSEEDPTVQRPATRVRRESVTFRLAFLPQRRCHTCIRQNSDSSSGSGHPLLREGDSLDCRTPPVPLHSTVTPQRRHQFRIGRQGSSGEEMATGSGSESGTPRHLPFRRPLAIAAHEESDSSKSVFVNHNNNEAMKKTGAVILELEEQQASGSRSVARSAALLQETSMEQSLPLSASREQCGEPLAPRQDSSQSDTTVRQDSNYSDVTVDSGVVVDMVAVNRSHSSSSSLSASSVSVPKRHRHKLQRLAAVEDEEACAVATIHEAVETPSVKSRLKSSFKARFYRPAFRIPKCDF